MFSFAFPFRASKKCQISYDVSLQNHYRNVRIIDVNEGKKFQYKRNTNDLLKHIIQRNNNVVILMLESFYTDITSDKSDARNFFFHDTRRD